MYWKGLLGGSNMDVRNCKGCGKLFNYLNGPPLCPACMKSLDLKFEQVKDFIYDHPGAGIQEVSEENDVTISQIKNWVRQERLTFSDDSPIGLECESCGAIVKTGRYCKSCKEKMANHLGDIYKKEEPPMRKADKKENPKMRFLDKQ